MRGKVFIQILLKKVRCWHIPQNVFTYSALDHSGSTSIYKSVSRVRSRSAEEGSTPEMVDWIAQTILERIASGNVDGALNCSQTSCWSAAASILTGRTVKPRCLDSTVFKLVREKLTALLALEISFFVMKLLNNSEKILHILSNSTQLQQIHRKVSTNTVKWRKYGQCQAGIIAAWDNADMDNRLLTMNETQNVFSLFLLQSYYSQTTLSKRASVRHPTGTAFSFASFKRLVCFKDKLDLCFEGLVWRSAVWSRLAERWVWS